jgi:hypothetical protein
MKNSTPAEIRAEFILKKARIGFRGMPDHVVALMLADYRRARHFCSGRPIMGARALAPLDSSAEATQ